jgi:hypothetical protein
MYTQLSNNYEISNYFNYYILVHTKKVKSDEFVAPIAHFRGEVICIYLTLG